MGEVRNILKRQLARLAIGAGSLALGVFFAVTGDSVYEVMLFSGIFALIGAVCLGPVACEILAEPFRSLFYPTDRFDRAQPIYGAPAGMRARGHYEEAIAGYEKLIAGYPDELQPYLSLMEVAIVDLKDPVRGRQFYQRGLAVFATDASKQSVLAAHYQAQLERLSVKPEWLKAQEARTLNVQKKTDTTPVPEPDGLTARRYHPGGYNQA